MSAYLLLTYLLTYCGSSLYIYRVGTSSSKYLLIYLLGRTDKNLCRCFGVLTYLPRLAGFSLIT